MTAPAAFQSNAFQNNAFQVGGNVISGGGAVNALFAAAAASAAKANDVGTAAAIFAATAPGVGAGTISGVGTAAAIFAVSSVRLSTADGPVYDVGSSISGGTFTDSGWKPASVKWSRQRHDAFLEAVREEARRKLAEERQLTAIGRAERDMRAAEETCIACDAEFNRNATRTNHTAQTEARERLETARAKVNEMHSIEYIERLWANYHAKRNRGRN